MNPSFVALSDSPCASRDCNVYSRAAEETAADVQPRFYSFLPRLVVYVNSE